MNKIDGKRKVFSFIKKILFEFFHLTRLVLILLVASRLLLVSLLSFRLAMAAWTAPAVPLREGRLEGRRETMGGVVFLKSFFFG